MNMIMGFYERSKAEEKNFYRQCQKTVTLCNIIIKNADKLTEKDVSKAKQFKKQSKNSIERYEKMNAIVDRLLGIAEKQEETEG